MFDTFKKSKFIKRAIRRYMEEGEAPVDEIYEFIKGNKQLAPVAESFELTKEDVNHIIVGMMACGAGGRHKGHFSPISGLLFADTLAHLLRAQRGHFSEVDAYYEVNEHFRTGALVFRPG